MENTSIASFVSTCLEELKEEGTLDPETAMMVRNSATMALAGEIPIPLTHYQKAPSNRTQFIGGSDTVRRTLIL
jgi:hypothetical protein